MLASTASRLAAFAAGLVIAGGAAAGVGAATDTAPPFQDCLKVAAAVPTGAGAHEVAFSDDNRFAYVSNRADGTLSVIDIRGLAKLKDVKTGAPASARQEASSERIFPAEISNIRSIFGSRSRGVR